MKYLTDKHNTAQDNCTVPYEHANIIGVLEKIQTQNFRYIRVNKYLESLQYMLRGNCPFILSVTDFIGLWWDKVYKLYNDKSSNKILLSKKSNLRK